MNGILKRIFLVVGLLLHIFDFASDIYVAVQYWKNSEVWWFSLTIIFIVVPSVMVNVTGIFQLPNIWSCLASILQLSFLVRYIETVACKVMLFGDDHPKRSTVVVWVLHRGLYHVTSVVFPIIHRVLQCIVVSGVSLEHHDTRKRKNVIERSQF